MMDRLAHALLLSVHMLWEVAWSLALGFILSGLLQALVPRERMREVLGGNGTREIALATLFGAASSSCSYASAAITRTLFKRGAGLAPSLAFLFASTNLVIELGIILFLLLGWQFTAAEWIGGVLLVAIMAVLVRLTAPAGLIEAARSHQEAHQGHEHDSSTVPGATLRERLTNPELPVRVAQTVAMDVSMLWKDLLIGFLVAGLLASFVPSSWWGVVFLHDAPAWLRLPLDALVGPALAVVSFVCSIGNVPLAALLWSSGAGFGGVLAFLYGDLIVLPLLDIYRRQYGWRMAAYIGCVFYITMAVAALLMALAFEAAGLVPRLHGLPAAMSVRFRIDYTFWLNVLAGLAALVVLVINRRHPMAMDHAAHHHHHEHDHGS